MRLVVNGESQELPAATLADALQSLNFAEAKVATALNGEFVPARARQATTLKDGDRIEIVGAAAGRVRPMISSPDFTLYGVKLRSRLMLGTSQYPSPAILAEAARASGAEILTVSLRRELARLKEGQDFWRLIRDTGARVLPNTAGCHSVKEAVTTAQMAREVFGTPWVKLEVIGEADTLQPDVFGLVEAARILSADGFQVFPYTTEDLVVAERLIEAGCQVLMPWGAPIGSGKGLNNVFGLRALRAHFPEAPLIVDAGLGLPSQAAAAMELGYDGVLLNTAVAKAGDPVAMARAFGQAIEAGRSAFLAGPMESRDMAAPSTPVVGRAVLS